MAQFMIPTAAADPVRLYLEGVAKSLVERLYGADGPAWGTKLAEIEQTILAVRHELSEKMLHEALQRQANTAKQRPAAFQCCPKCGKEVEDKPVDDDPRSLNTEVGEANWHEPETYCRTCRRSFFPSDQESGH
jgi:uncharacterized protein with PIN domain